MIGKILAQNNVIEQCISKRNQVSIVQDEHKNSYVWKKMSDKKAQEKELELLTLLYDSGVPVPRILEVCESDILLEYIEGELYLERFEKLEELGEKKEAIVPFIEQLLHWLEQFYQVTRQHYKETIVLHDVNFRNFILHNECVYGIDMELCGPGKVEGDIGSMAAFALMYSPIDTVWKQDFVKIFLEKAISRLHLDREMVEDAYANELRNIRERRNLDKK